MALRGRGECRSYLSIFLNDRNVTPVPRQAASGSKASSSRPNHNDPGRLARRSYCLCLHPQPPSPPPGWVRRCVVSTECRSHTVAASIAFIHWGYAIEDISGRFKSAADLLYRSSCLWLEFSPSP